MTEQRVHRYEVGARVVEPNFLPRPGVVIATGEHVVRRDTADGELGVMHVVRFDGHGFEHWTHGQNLAPAVGQ